METDYLIVGGGLAGGYASLSIREKDKNGKILLISEEKELPYDRVPLSKEFLLDKIAKEQLYITTREELESNAVNVELGRRVIQIDLSNRVAKLDNNEKVSFKKILISTGGSPRRLRIEGSNLDGIYYFRTLDDAERIKSKLSSVGNVIIVGGGFIGCELASALNVKGLKVTIVEMLDSLLGAVLDKEMATWITKYFLDKGVNLKLNTRISKFIGENNKVIGVETDKGEIIKGDLVIVAVGISPNDSLAKDAGLKVDNGVIVNEYLESDVKGVFSAGDVARFLSPIYNEYMRIEHYDVAVKQGKIAGYNMVGEMKKFDEIPYFFSRMFDAKLNFKVYGVLNRYDNIVQRGPDGKGGMIRFYLKGNVINGIMLVNASLRESVIKRLIRKKVDDVEKLRSGKLEEIS
ncbi:hypothetical protein BFU36_13210 [Sulfolobus sp. A20]|uniref:NAD(P)/FAD-dependent oxidoreductase n=3 Tax=Sulfolobaceae TaxID=118883 RepID=UPI0008460D41|nr:NAD(P)/FAD-dependent oxidoreductase [Sulfolobus sp. A20]TRM75946.1 FAD-dependent oxidoreductase [Sulfolobus sp. A20-N-F8]TRM79053.1 FAD-dependent oxidoreductase [Sulfolobus sp. B5]TRM82246.1 FAD-dependent oxidoreductase [Sulfolobus sp. D5]TRM83358.1 FAD-dependent oxidoreductase [Sulfolobus sp. F3]TRM86667.1 FAD-dependent oxidoreductase [Sulfolobus sp. E3]TRM87976.1 FAD-dependent oxidoreductase [Sulfolobus sp. C3]TRM93747.1 FAD-dependent oxidoreductase [Sulfolobus sp. A20-N-G8]TRM99181.1 